MTARSVIIPRAVSLDQIVKSQSAQFHLPFSLAASAALPGITWFYWRYGAVAIEERCLVWVVRIG